MFPLNILLRSGIYRFSLKPSIFTLHDLFWWHFPRIMERKGRLIWINCFEQSQPGKSSHWVIFTLWRFVWSSWVEMSCSLVYFTLAEQLGPHHSSYQQTSIGRWLGCHGREGKQCDVVEVDLWQGAHRLFLFPISVF